MRKNIILNIRICNVYKVILPEYVINILLKLLFFRILLPSRISYIYFLKHLTY